MYSWLQATLQGIAFAFLLAGSFYFGLMTHPVEMGTTIIAASIALGFLNIDKIRRFKGAGFEAEMHEKLDAIIAKETEPAKDTAIEPSITPPAPEAGSPAASQVVNSLGNSKYTWRSIAGIATETSLSKRAVLDILQTLMKQGLVVSTTSGGKTTWALTASGRGLLGSNG